MDSREIKFRGKRLDNGEWVYGDLIHKRSGKTYIHFYECNGFECEYRVDPETVGQYIRRNDEDGIEIYKGDKLAVVNPNGEDDTECIVEWDEDGCCYSYAPNGGYGDFDVTSIGWAMTFWYEFKVIGNKYDNPELMPDAGK